MHSVEVGASYILGGAIGLSTWGLGSELHTSILVALVIGLFTFALLRTELIEQMSTPVHSYGHSNDYSKRQHVVGGSSIEPAAESEASLEAKSHGPPLPRTAQPVQRHIDEGRTYLVRQCGIRAAPKNVAVRVGGLGISILLKARGGENRLQAKHTYLYQFIRVQLVESGVIIYEQDGGEISLTGAEGEEMAVDVQRSMAAAVDSQFPSTELQKHTDGSCEEDSTPKVSIPPSFAADTTTLITAPIANSVSETACMYV
jgi:hypothetical protein